MTRTEPKKTLDVVAMCTLWFILAVTASCASPPESSQADSNGVDIYRPKPIAVYSVESGPVQDIAFHPDGDTIAIGASVPNLTIWRFTNDTQVTHPRGHSDRVQGLAFLSNGCSLVTVGRDRTLRKWRTKDWHCVVSTHRVGGTGLAVNASEEIIATPVAGPSWEVLLVDVGALGHVKKLKGHKNIVSALAFAPSRDKLASGDYDSTVILWDAKTGKQLSKLTVDYGWVLGLAFSPDGSKLATCGSGAVIDIWDLSSLSVMQSFEDLLLGISTVTFSDCGGFLIGAIEDLETPACIKVWTSDGTDAGLMVQCGEEGVDDYIKCFAVSPDGTYLATGSVKGKVMIWRMADLTSPISD